MSYLAHLKQAKTEEQIKSLTVSNVKKEYNTLAKDYNKIINLEYVYCPCCGEFKTASNYYSSKKTKSGLEHLGCKSCILDMATDYDPKTKIRTDNREKTIEVFKKMDLPFIEEVYKSQLRLMADDAAEKQRSTAFQQLLTLIKSLPQYNDKDFSYSEFDLDSEQAMEKEDTKIVQKTLKAAKKRFGQYSQEDLMFLENEYQDWVSRYECNTKANEEVFENLAVIKLLKKKAIKEGKSTKDLDAQQQNWLDTGNLKPKQNTMDTLSEAQTLGTLIQKYEETRPLPEIDEELKDCDKIGLYIDAFYRGHSCKMLGIKNRFSNIYEKVMAKYTVTPPEYDEEADSEIIFEKIFGNTGDE